MTRSLVGDFRARDRRRQIERLSGLPLRAATVRAVLAGLLSDPGSPPDPEVRRLLDLDPGWSLARLRGVADPREIVAEHAWWPGATGAARSALTSLWRHAVLASYAAVGLASAGRTGDLETLGRVALLHSLGYWALAATAPEELARLLAIADPRRRRAAERALLGLDAAALGRDLAERWAAPVLLADAAWLHARPRTDWSGCVEHPGALSVIQAAHALAERSPWALSGPAAPWPDLGPDPRDPDLRRLVARVQIHCAPEFTASEAAPAEERLARAYAQLSIENARLRDGNAARDNILRTLGAAVGCETFEPAPEAEPRDTTPPGPNMFAGPDRTPPGRGADAEPNGQSTDPMILERAGPAARKAWLAWEAQQERVVRLVRRLDAMTEAHQQRNEAEGVVWGYRERLDALAEFSAGASHELNNPLAVILGRAQLLLARANDPDVRRSLRAIIAQAQRAHRILRDLMYVARPPDPRPRRLQPDTILRTVLEDLREEARSRRVRLESRGPQPLLWAWADPDALRHLADVLLRNALEVTPPGGTVWVSTRSRPDRLDWIVRDGGPGLDPQAGRHLLDPFFCGRQAGRGLGLGLSRAARFVTRAGGRLRWRSTSGRGTSFHLLLPLAEPALDAAQHDPTTRARAS